MCLLKLVNKLHRIRVYDSFLVQLLNNLHRISVYVLEVVDLLKNNYAELVCIFVKQSN